MRVAVASHNLRSVAHAIACNRALGAAGPRPRAPGPARPRRRPSARARGERPARANLLPGGRPRRRHGVSGPPAAREHEQRVVPRRTDARRERRGAARRAVKPFSNEPHAELRRAPGARGAAGRAARARGRRCPGACPSGSATSAVRRTGSSRPIPAIRSGWSRPAGGRRRPTSTGRSRSRRGAAPATGAGARAAERAEVLVARGGRAAPAPARAGRAPGARVREAVGRGRRRRLRGDRLPRVLRAAGARARARAGRCCEVPGERNVMRYAPRGVCAVISPWNFPLAIPTGMVAGGARERKRGDPEAGRAVAGAPGSPASRRCARRACRPRRSTSCPARATSGRRSCGIRGVATIAFTGSRAVGLEIIEAAAAHARRASGT